MSVAMPHERTVVGRPLAEMTLPSSEVANVLKDVLSSCSSVEIRHGSTQVSMPADLQLFLVEALSAGAEGQEVTRVLRGEAPSVTGPLRLLDTAE